MAKPPAAGTFCWNELMTRDAGAARSFYAALFGWKMSDMPLGPGVTYTILKSGATDAGGLMQIQPDMGPVPSHWMAYVLVTDVDAATRKAGQLGAKVLVPGTDIPGIGRFGVFEDPTGATLAVYQPLRPAAGAKKKAAAKSKGKARKAVRKGRRK